jgi:hypothetical protein
MMRCTVLANRRQTCRHAVQIPCQVVREEDFRLISNRILNLSMSGVVVATAERVLLGEQLIVSFRLPNSTFWLDTEATVRRVSRARRYGERTPMLALEFEPLPGLSRLILMNALAGAPPAPPLARPGRRSTGQTLRALLRTPRAMAAAF